jgi:hypothetical protein
MIQVPKKEYRVLFFHDTQNKTQKTLNIIVTLHIVYIRYR